MEIASLKKHHLKGLLKVSLTLFLVLFSYPLIRASSTALFIDAYGAKNSPIVWLFSLIALSIAVTLYNRYQKKSSIQFLYLITAVVTFVVLCGSSFFILIGYDFFTYLLFIWKEVYIVLLVHMAIGHLNTLLEYRSAKLFYGPLGAISSLGGVLGGGLTSWLTRIASDLGDTGAPLFICMVGVSIMSLSCFSFWGPHVQKTIVLNPDGSKRPTPFQSISEVRPYVIAFVLLIVLTQFVINLANFKFNLQFEQFVLGKIEKTRFLGLLYSSVNFVSLSIQVLLVPVVLRIFKLSSIHYAIPFFYLFLFIITFAGSSAGLMPIAIFFVFYKGIDYSIFSAAKEMLYFPLNNSQKMGAKYLVDMVFYRAGKGVISIILMFVQSISVINFLLAICLILWFVVLVFLFQYYRKLIPKKN